MDDYSNKTQSLSKQHQQQQQEISQHHQSSVIPFTSFRNNISSSSSSISTNSLPTVPFNTSSIKHFFNKTLAKVAQTNLSDYTAEYAATFANTNNYNNSPANFQAIKTTVSYDGLVNGPTTEIDSSGVDGGGLTGISNGLAGYAAAADMAVTSLSNGSQHLETTTAFPSAQTVATFIVGNKNRATTIIVYPTGWCANK